MSRDFERTEAALASSFAGRVLGFVDDAIASAWRSSSAGAAFRSFRAALQVTPEAMVIRTVAVAIMIAAALQPLLISQMPATVVPAMPWPAYAVAALFAAFAAWQARAIAAAWRDSRIARLSGR